MPQLTPANWPRPQPKLSTHIRCHKLATKHTKKRYQKICLYRYEPNSLSPQNRLWHSGLIKSHICFFICLDTAEPKNISNRKCCWGRLSDRSKTRNLHKPLAAELLFHNVGNVSGQWKVRCGPQRKKVTVTVASCNGKLSPICAPPASAATAAASVTNSRRAKTFRLNGGCCHSRLCAGVKLTHIRWSTLVWA